MLRKYMYYKRCFIDCPIKVFEIRNKYYYILIHVDDQYCTCAL